MTERRILGDLDFDDGWFGREQTDAAESLAAPELDDYPRYPAEYDPDDPDPEPTPAPQHEETPWSGILGPRNGRPGAPQATSWESKLANSGAWDFKVSTTGPWYRSKRVLIAAAAVAVVALVLTGVIVFTGGSDSGVEEPAPVSPSSPTTVGPAPSSPSPVLSTEVAPPPLPPPLPPSADQITVAPTRGYTPPRRSAPSESNVPEIGVTRTPVTRVPFSATPPPPPAPDRNSSTPGDGPRGGWGRW